MGDRKTKNEERRIAFLTQYVIQQTGNFSDPDIMLSDAIRLWKRIIKEIK